MLHDSTDAQYNDVIISAYVDADQQCIAFGAPKAYSY